MKRTIFVLSALLLLLTVIANATDYFVDKDSISGNCSDSNPGTLTQPWCRISKANTELMPGDTVYIRGGTYQEQISPARSGTSNNYITYKAFSGETPVIDRSNILTNWNHYQGSIYWASYSNVDSVILWEDTFEEAGYYCGNWVLLNSLDEVDGPGKHWRDTTNKRFYVWLKDGDNPDNHVMRTSVGRGASFSNDYIVIDGIKMIWLHRGIYAPGSSHSIFKNNDIQYVSAFGIYVGRGGHHNQILNNTIFHVGSWYRDEGDGIHLGPDAHYNLIQGNDISLTAHNPIASYGASGPAPHHNIIQNNVVHDSGSSGLNPNVWPYKEVWRNNIAYGNTGAGLQTDSSNNIIYWNKFYNNGWLEDAESEGITIYAVTTRGILVTDNNKFFHNVIYNNMGRGVAINDWGGICNNNVFKNNILFDNEGQPDDVQIRFDTAGELDGNVFTHNLIYKDTGTKVRVQLIGINPLSWWEQNYVSNFNNNVQSNPFFVDEPGYDFNLLNNSPAIDAGTWLTTTISAGTGTNLPVQDASYFIDGYGIVEGDLIQLENQTVTARIIGVDYNANVLMLNISLTWDEGQGVHLPYSGAAPDIGAYEFVSSSPTPTPLPIPGDLNEDGVVDIADLIIIATSFGLSSGFDERADTDSNGEVDIFDIVFVASRFT